jgi:hypothetical protein
VISQLGTYVRSAYYAGSLETHQAMAAAFHVHIVYLSPSKRKEKLHFKNRALCQSRNFRFGRTKLVSVNEKFYVLRDAIIEEEQNC